MVTAATATVIELDRINVYPATHGIARPTGGSLGFCLRRGFAPFGRVPEVRLGAARRFLRGKPGGSLHICCHTSPLPNFRNMGMMPRVVDQTSILRESGECDAQ